MKGSVWMAVLALSASCPRQEGSPPVMQSAPALEPALGAVPQPRAAEGERLCF